MMLGKLFFGMGAGVLIAVAPRILEETIPANLIDSGFGAMTNVGVDVMSLTSTIFIMFMPKKGEKDSAADMKTSTAYKVLYLLPIPMFATSFLLNIMCFRRETMGYYIHRKDKENSIRCLRQIYMGESMEEYNERYEEMCADDDLNYKEPGDYLAAAKDSTAKMTKILNKLAKAESEISGEISKLSKEVSDAEGEFGKGLAMAANASQEVSDAEDAIAKAPGDALSDAISAGGKGYDKLQKQVEDGDVMGLYKQAKGLKTKVEGLGDEKKKLMSEYSSAKGKLKAAND
tara:strand:- start:1096 stop:1959 length:864 start_codon:yes stop_codon:yes gene_type:complete